LLTYRDNAIHFYNQQGFGVIIYGLAQTNIVNYRDIMCDIFEIDIAEEMKKKYATLIPGEEASDQEMSIPGDGHNVSARDLNDIIYARIEELIRLIVLELPRNDYARVIPAGVVLIV